MLRNREMMEIMWILVALLPFLTEVISDVKVSNLTFKLGSNVKLNCGNQTWNETVYVIWRIGLAIQPKSCMIAFEISKSVDTCMDGKSLRNTSSGQLYLHIPNFSNKDVGIYTCDSPYKGGRSAYSINVNIIVPPSLSGWLEADGEQVVAVCRAERGKPAANISWSQTGHIVKTLLEPGGFVTVESRLELLEGTDRGNLTCLINHSYWSHQQILLPQLKKAHEQVYAGSPWITAVTVLSAIVFVGGVLFYAQRKLVGRCCQQSGSSQSKSAPKEEMEEVEPYASYVQRVNDLYNSPADIFT